jgi:membrane fusion protein, multidrug efflux system
VDELALLRYQELARKAGQDLRPSRLKDLKLPIEIGLANEEGFPHMGVIDFTDNKIDRATGTLHVRGVFENTGEYLTPGLFVRVRIPFGTPHKVLLVPERTIHRDQRQKYLLVVNKENIVEYRQVQVGPLRKGMRVIESGIDANDWVIVKGLQRAPRSGTPVAPHTEQADVAAPAPESAAAPAAVEKSEQAHGDQAKAN